MTYAEQLQDPRWQEKRKLILGLAHHTCQWCQEKRLTLHVHHIEYKPGRMAWEYSRFELMVLCEVCHSHFHAKGELPPKYKPGLKSIGEVMSGFFGHVDNNIKNG